MTIMDDLRAHPPGKLALVCHQDGGAVELTYGELLDRVDRMATLLRGLGVGRGQIVTLQLPNSWQLAALILACYRIGAVPGPVVPIMRRREVQFMLNLTESPVYIAKAEFRGFSYRRMIDDVDAPTLRHALFVDDLELPSPDLGGVAESGPGDPAQVAFTSGTTGEPKGVVHTHDSLHAMNRAQADVLHLTEGVVTAMGSPTTHQAGFTWNLFMPLLLGGTAVHVESWDAGRMLDILQERGVTFFMGAPTFLSDLIEAQAARPRDLRRLETFATGSAPIAPYLVERARDVLGCRLYALWGMTENGCVTITRPEDPPMRAAESDGTVVPGMEVRITGEGRLQVRGASQCAGYFRREHVYRACLTDDGWFDTGDLARDDGHGGIRITGRAKDVIMRGAENIPVVEVEAALLRHSSVRDVAVVGYPDERLGERACAVLVASSGVTLDDLRVHLAGLGMAKQYWPERLELVPSLPRTPSGKIQKFALREGLR